MCRRSTPHAPCYATGHSAPGDAVGCILQDYSAAIFGTPTLCDCQTRSCAVKTFLAYYLRGYDATLNLIRRCSCSYGEALAGILGGRHGCRR